MTTTVNNTNASPASAHCYECGTPTALAGFCRSCDWVLTHQYDAEGEGE